MNDQSPLPIDAPVNFDVGRLREAAAYSHNFATAKPNIGDAEREHLLGLCTLLSQAADAIDASRARMCFERAKATVAERNARRLLADNDALRAALAGAVNVLDMLRTYAGAKYQFASSRAGTAVHVAPTIDAATALLTPNAEVSGGRSPSA